ncbi:MAG: protein jag [Defluviitaleaceae bacterium]|nr:protein jag [Defluviitaleaceae bacterium]
MEDIRDSIERSGKTVDEAVADAVRQLGTTRENVDVEVLQEAKSGILGIGSKPAKVRVTVKPSPEHAAREFLEEVIKSIGIDATFEFKHSEKQLNIMINGKDIGILIGKRGQTLDSLQYLVNLVINKGTAPYVNVILDAENYRRKRKETLESLAHNLVKKARATRKKVVLEPMTSYERRIIHAALQSERGIDTYSEGDDPYRYVVISPKSDR